MLIYNFTRQYNKKISNGLKMAYIKAYFTDNISKQYELPFAKGNSGYFG